MALGINFDITANPKNFQRGMEQVDRSLNKTSNTLKKIGSLIGGVFAGIQVTRFVKDSVNAFYAQERAEKRLESITKSVTGATDKQIAGLKNLASSLQKVGVIGDEVAIVGQSQLATFKMSTDSIAKLTPALENLAVATYGVNVSQEQMQNMANLMGRVYQGNVGALTRYGITLSDTQEELLKMGSEQEKVNVITDIMKQNFGDLNEAMAKTSQGQMVQFRNAWGDLTEQIGQLFIPIITKVVKKLNEFLPILSKFFSDPLESIQNFINGLGAVSKAVLIFSGSFVAFSVATKAINTLRTASLLGGKAIIGVFKNLFSWPMLIVAGIIVLQTAWDNNWFGMRDTLVEVWNKISPVLETFWVWVKKIGSQALEIGFNLAGNAWEWIKANWDVFSKLAKSFWDWLSPLVSKAIDFGVNLAGDFWDWIVSVYPKVKDSMSTLFSWLSDITKQTWSLAVKGFDFFATFAKDFPQNIADLTTNALESIKELGENLGKNLWENLKNAWELVVDFPKILTDSFLNVGQSMLEMGKNIANSIWKGIKEMFSKYNPWNLLFGKKGTVTVGNKSFDIDAYTEGHKEGGVIRGPGTGTSDSIPAWLSNGEFVVTAEATRRYRPILDLMNQNKFATGTPPTTTTTIIDGRNASNFNTPNDFGEALNQVKETIKKDFGGLSDITNDLIDKMGLKLEINTEESEQMNELVKSFEDLNIKTLDVTDTQMEYQTAMNKVKDSFSNLNDTLASTSDANSKVSTIIDYSLQSSIAGAVDEFNASGDILSAVMAGISGGAEALSSSFMSLLGVGSILAMVFMGVFSIIAPAINGILLPIMKVFDTLGKIIGIVLLPLFNAFGSVLAPVMGLVSFLMDGLKAIGKVFYLVTASISWAVDQLVLGLNAVLEWIPFVDGFLNNSQKKQMSKSVEQRMIEGNKAINELDTNFQPVYIDVGNVDTSFNGGDGMDTTDGDTFQAGETRAITNNISITIRDNEVIDDNSEALETLAEKIAKVFERRNDLQVMIGGA